MTITNVAFQVPGDPQGKGRARVGKVAGHARLFTPIKTVHYEGVIALAAQQAMADAPPWAGAVALAIVVHHVPPASWSRVKREAALAGARPATCKPDLDNIAKAVGDACNGVVWVDDKQIASLSITRRYSLTPGLWVTAAVQDATR